MSGSTQDSQPSTPDGEIDIAGVRVRVRNGTGVLPQGTSLRTTVTRPASTRKLRAGAAALKGVQGTAAYEPAAIAARIIGALGNNVTAALLGVAKDRPSRWAAGTDQPSEQSRVRLADLDALLVQLLAVFTPEQSQLWLEGEDPHLQARPLDVFRLEGPSPVIAAIHAYEQGAFA